MNTTNKKSPTLFKEAVIAEAKVMKRKEELYEEIMRIETELKTLSEHGFVGTFGFQNQSDMNTKTTTGFEGTQNISRISELAEEMGVDLDESSEVDKLKAENEQLKNKLAEASKKG
tara:strand:- start:26287 stop:26634 length:348 start_codon:yes stop_codon:yes gene_type:complete